MVPLALLILIAAALVAGALLKLFADHRAFRRQLREVEQQLETVLDVLGTVALNAGDTARIDRVQRQVRAKNEERPKE
jgi:Flp pilus assembly protein TadB